MKDKRGIYLAAAAGLILFLGMVNFVNGDGIFKGGAQVMGGQTQKTVYLFDAVKKEMVEVPLIKKTSEQWKDILPHDVYHILREKGTERAFTGKFYNYKVNGIYICAACGNHLFSSLDKFDSGSGWPSFIAPVHMRNIRLKEDRRIFLVRTEVVCARCGGHLGHVFDDGPLPLGKRYCVNSLALDFLKEGPE